MWAYNFLRTKYFHEVSPASLHAYSLKSRYGIVSYNVLFRSPAGKQSPAQVEAFEDTWHWTEEAEKAFDEVMTSGNTDAAEMLRAMRFFLKENDLMAYLAMMAIRLVELHRVLKPTGSIYLHCDPTASHYLKLVMDAIFEARNFRDCLKTDPEACWQVDTFSGHLTGAQSPQNNMITSI